jgi:hypothetical protein
MKTTLIALQIAAAAMLAPIAVSLASTTPKAAAKPAAPAVQLQASAPPTPASQAAPVTLTAPATSCATKVRVVYAGYSQPAPNRC